MNARATVFAALLAMAAGAAGAGTAPSRQLVLDYVDASGMPQDFDQKMAAFNNDLIARASPDQAEKITRAVTSTVGWPVLKEDVISLIQRIYTAEDLEAMIAFARSPSGRGVAEKNQLFYSAMAKMMQKQARVLSSMMPPEATEPPPPLTTMGGSPKAPLFSYVVPPQPVYPKQSRVNNEQGIVRMRVLVSAKGEVEAVGLQQSSGFPRLDESALAAMAQAKFRPNPENGTPVRTYLPASLEFHLEEADDAAQK